MVKIVEEHVWLKFACKCCESKIEAEPQDVEYGYLDADYTSRGEGSLVVKCPKCGQVHKVPEKKITQKLYQIAQEKSPDRD